MKRLARLALISLAVSCVPLSMAAPVLAASAAKKPAPLNASTNSAATNQPSALSSAAGISVTPAVQDLALSPATKTVRYSVQIYNHTSQTLTMQLSSRDFTTLNQTGGISFLGSNLSDATTAHGLSSILQLDSPIITLAPNTSKTVTASINDVSRLAPGGHYAAIIAQTINGDSGTGTRVGLNAAVSSLVFLETAGEGSKTLTLLPFGLGKLSFSLPTDQNLVFQATGNTQTVPRGVISVGHGDDVRLRGQINADSGLILPGSSRLLDTALTGDRHPWWPGTYTMTVQYQYDGSLGVSTVTKTFFYVNLLALLIMVVIVILLLYGLVLLRRHWRVVAPPIKFVLVRVYGGARQLRKSVLQKQAVVAPAEPVEVATEPDLEETIVETTDADDSIVEAADEPDTAVDAVELPPEPVEPAAEEAAAVESETPEPMAEKPEPPVKSRTIVVKDASEKPVVVKKTKAKAKPKSKRDNNHTKPKKPKSPKSKK